jgi:hypothetical protein
MRSSCHREPGMTSYNGGEFADLEIFFEPSAAPAQGKEATLCELVVEALLGEELRLVRVGAITSMSVPDVRGIENTTPMKQLRRHLIEVLMPDTGRVKPEPFAQI